jgi:hypothetical protein
VRLARDVVAEGVAQRAAGGAHLRLRAVVVELLLLQRELGLHHLVLEGFDRLDQRWRKLRLAGRARARRVEAVDLRDVLDQQGREERRRLAQADGEGRRQRLVETRRKPGHRDEQRVEPRAIDHRDLDLVVVGEDRRARGRGVEEGDLAEQVTGTEPREGDPAPEMGALDAHRQAGPACSVRLGGAIVRRPGIGGNRAPTLLSPGRAAL